MTSALTAAIEAATAAEQYAARSGRQLSFNAGDVRSIAATIFIHRGAK